MLYGVVIGYDPGGNGNHGVAELQVAEGKATSLSTRTLKTVENVIADLDNLSSIAALGVDTLTCWSTGTAAWRPADRWLRERYTSARNSVMSPNTLSGSMSLNGMSVLIAARNRFTNLLITETHPKVLYSHLSGKKYDYHTSKVEMDTMLTKALGVSVAPENDHEWDAAISAFAALESISGRWCHDLHEHPIERGERLVTPCGNTHYFWPE